MTKGKKKQQPQRAARQRPPRRAKARKVKLAREPENVLIPSGVNNRATMPTASQTYSFGGEEVIATYTAPEVAEAGHKIFNAQISHTSVARLALLANGFQRIKWNKCHLHLVALNGSTTTSGYTAGFFEDPQIEPPADGSAVIPTLTALRSATVRQNWVESTTGMLLKLSDLPEMYTTLGSDIRRFAIGRFVAALTGSPGPNTTYQLMLKYHVTLSVPQAATLGGIVPTDEFLVTNNVSPGANGNAPDTGPAAGDPLGSRPSLPVTSTAALPPPGEWLCPGGTGYIALKSTTGETFAPGLDWEDATDIMDKVYSAYDWERVYSIIVAEGSTWDTVLHRTSETGAPRPWTTGQLIGPIVVTAGLNNRGMSVPANFRGFQPRPFPTSESGPAQWPKIFGGTPILQAGDSLFRRAATSTSDVAELFSQVKEKALLERIAALELMHTS